MRGDPKEMSQLALEIPVGVKPPAAPWSPLRVAQPATGYLSMYLADDLSRLPVRHITRPHDNKSDPNIETGTYGLFSTCEHQMRSGIVNRGAQYIVFVCRWDGRRVVSGFYRLAWRAPGTLHSPKKADFVLAADTVHFINPPIPVSGLPEHLAAVAGTRFRLFKRLESAHTEELISILSGRPNALLEYLAEIDRLERFQAFHSGYRYVSWQQREPFTWDMAHRYLEPSASLNASPNQSATGTWLCANSACGLYVVNQALLKRCPFCGSMGTLQPVTDLAETYQEGMRNGTSHIH